MREASVRRTTKETDIEVELALDGSGDAVCDTGVPAFDHIMQAFGRHGLFDMRVVAKGDLEIDAHHTVEDCGIALGQAFDQALGDRAGIRRFGDCILPMDEALIMAAVDISGRGQLHWDVDVPIEMIGVFDTSLVKEFAVALCTNMGMTLHVRKLAGENTHHIMEATMKAIGRAVSEAVSIDPRREGQIPSTKGTI
ncbi:MAG: imidazoleglycerol-phosphate dehydratase HisB [Coriobacteriales bacterium]|jgi:imidazoleglycerol-phosphate dehydratase